MGTVVWMNVLLGAGTEDDAGAKVDVGALALGGEGTSPLAVGAGLGSMTVDENAKTAKAVCYYNYLTMQRSVLITVKMLITKKKITATE